MFLVFILSPLSFALLQSVEGYALISGQIVLGTLVASFVGPNHAFMQTLFPAKTRYTGIAMSFCIGMAITGGSIPMLLTYLIDMSHNLYVPAFVLMAYAAFAGVVLLATGSSCGEQHQPKEQKEYQQDLAS